MISCSSADYTYVLTASKEKEYEQIIRQTFEPVIMAEKFPRAVISIVVQVIEDNGSLLSVAINAVSLALLDAGVPMLAVVTSATCGMLADGGLILDPSRAEEEVNSNVTTLDEETYWLVIYGSEIVIRQQQSASLVTTACSSTYAGVLTSVTNGMRAFHRSRATIVFSEGLALNAGLLTEEQYFACSEACQRCVCS